MPTDVRIFSGRMNDDDHGTVLPVTDYRYAQNVHVIHSADGGVAAIKNVPGTTEVEFALAGISGVRVVGSVEDEENNRVFYFVKATSGNDEILCFNRTDNTIRRVFGDGIMTSLDGQDASLGLSEDYLVTGVAFIYPWLFWTDNNQQPRRINVERGLRTYFTTYVSPDGTAPTPYSVPVNYKDISIIREPPRFPIETRKLISTDEADVTDQTTNQVGLYAFQFSYRFLYRDGEYSVLAPYSKTVHFNDDDGDDFDTVEVKIPKEQRIYNEVDEVQILVRNPQTNNWGVIKRYNRDQNSADYAAHNIVSGAALKIFFHNDRGYSFIQESEAIKPFDSVPLKSKAMEVGQNRLFLGNNLEGYDPTELLLLSASSTQENTVDAPFTGQYILVFPDTYGCTTAYYGIIVVKVDEGDPNIDGYYLVSYVDTLNDFLNGTLPTEVYLSPVAPYGKIGDLGDFDPFDTGLIAYFAALSGCTPGPNAYVDNAYIGQQPSVFGLGINSAIPVGSRVFKSGSRYQVGLVFYDYAGRNSGVYTNDDCIVAVPDRNYTGQFLTTGINWLIDGLVNNNNIPLWATHYSIVLTKNLTMSFFAQFFISPEPNTALYPDDTPEGAVVFNAEDLYAQGLGYTFAQGDVLKYYSDDDSDPVYFEILGTSGQFLFVSPRNDTEVTLDGIGEIYTPRRDEEDVYYEVGEFYPIFNAGTISKSFSVLSGTIRGDSVFKKRTSFVLDPAGTEYVTENMSPNDTVWQVWNTDAGRPNIVLIDSKQERRKTAIRWSNQYVAGSKINGLCTFDEIDEVVLEESSGPIQKLVLAGKAQSEGSVMLSIGTNNTFSLYLGETQIIDNSDQTLLATSGSIIGTRRALRGGYGTNHPESVVENDGRVYWYDEQRGAAIRYAANGLVPISDYKFRAYFNRLSGQTRGKDVLGGFDRLRSEYLISIQDLDADNDVEYLMDYDGEILATGSMGSNATVTDTNVEVLKDVEYDLEMTWTNAGTFKLYLITEDTVTLLDTIHFDNNETDTVTFTPSTNGTIGYTFVEDVFGSRADYTLVGPRISPHQAWRGQSLTLGFRDIDGIEGWSSFYSYLPEWFAKSGNLLITFKDGKLYRHDNEDAYNTFYGTEYTSGIAWVVNEPAALVKWAAAIGIQSNHTPSWIHIRTENPYIQSSDLEDEDMRLREGLYYGEIRRDRLSPNATGTYFEKSLKGDKMRSSLLEVYAEFSIFADELYVYLIKTMWQPSSGHF